MNETRSEALNKLFKDYLPFNSQKSLSSSVDSGMALPPSSLKLIIDSANIIGVKKVIEFGSGQSTLIFLDADFDLVSLEDSDLWMGETIKNIPEKYKNRHKPLVRPLKSVFSGLSPFRSWEATEEIINIIKAADMVLIDSPSYPASREHVLQLTLQLTSDVLVILDDTNIPPLRRFCERIAYNNPDLLYYRSEIDHGMAFFSKPNSHKFQDNRGFLETLKTWRRYYLSYQHEKSVAR